MRLALPLAILSTVMTCLSITLPATGQVAPQPAIPERTGAVSGHVIAGDTNQPARFAHVTLQPILQPSKPSPTTQQVSPSTSSSLPPTIGTTTDTDLDGNFTLAHIKPGAYYVVVDKDGYINARAMFTQKEIENPTPQIRAIIEAALPRVQIEADHTERADVRLERGAAVSGTVLYDDGSPAGGLSVKLWHKRESGKWISDNQFRKFVSTDDRGQFRIASLLPDEYLLEINMDLSDTKTSMLNEKGDKMEFIMKSFRFSLPFYGNGTPHQEEAAPFKLLSGEELTGQDMTLPISKLHHLTGRVAAGPDGHFVNAATLTLVNRNSSKEREKNFFASATISREDGLFHFEFIPDGDYILRVTNARDVAWEPAKPQPNAPPNPFPQPDVERVLETFGSAEQTLIFRGDQLGISLTIPPDASKKQKIADTAAAQ